MLQRKKTLSNLHLYFIKLIRPFSFKCVKLPFKCKSIKWNVYSFVGVIAPFSLDSIRFVMNNNFQFIRICLTFFDILFRLPIVSFYQEISMQSILYCSDKCILVDLEWYSQLEYLVFVSLRLGRNERTRKINK